MKRTKICKNRLKASFTALILKIQAAKNTNNLVCCPT